MPKIIKAKTDIKAIGAVLCEDGEIYKLYENGDWGRQKAIVGTVGSYDELPSKVERRLIPSELYNFVYKGVCPQK